MKKQAIIYLLGTLLILAALSIKFVSVTETADEVSEQDGVSASWNALSAGSFIFN